MNRPAPRILLAIALLLGASVLAPLCVLTASCPMPCCKGTVAGCAEPCGITRSVPAPALPDVVTAVVTIDIDLTPMTLDVAPPPRAIDFDAHRVVHRDAPLYLANSVFLI